MGKDPNTKNEEPSMDSQLLDAGVVPENVLRAQGYKIDKKLAQGGFAKVYIAEYQGAKAKLKLACKVVDIKIAQPKYVKKFLPRELEILMRINHPHIIRVHSIFRKKNMYFIFMRYAENGDLLDYILRYGAIKENQARIWVRQIALALQYLHALEIAHRDMKCENILVTSNFNIKVADFGFSRITINEKREQELSETYCGSYQYAPPEIIKGIPYNPKIADIWSLGVIVYTMLNETNPFNERNHKILYTLQMAKKYKFRKQFDDVSSEVKHLVEFLLEPDVKKRYKIEDVVKSKWIGMDSRLKSMTAAEYTALASALEEAKNLDPKSKGDNNSWIDKYPKDSQLDEVTVFKKFEGCELQFAYSEFNRGHEKLSS